MYSETVTVASACHRDGGPARGALVESRQPRSRLSVQVESIFYFKFSVSRAAAAAAARPGRPACGHCSESTDSECGKAPAGASWLATAHQSVRNRLSAATKCTAIRGRRRIQVTGKFCAGFLSGVGIPGPVPGRGSCRPCIIKFSRQAHLQARRLAKEQRSTHN
jgi:hypothetical protein